MAGEFPRQLYAPPVLLSDRFRFMVDTKQPPSTITCNTAPSQRPSMNNSYVSSAVLSYRHQQELSSEIQRKRQKLSHLTLEISRIKTKNATKELDVWKLEDVVGELRKLFGSVKANLRDLDTYKANTLDTLRSHFLLTCKEIDAEMNQKLLTLQEDVSMKFEALIQQAKVESTKKKRELNEENAKLSAEITALTTEVDLKRKCLHDKFVSDLAKLDAATQKLLAEKVRQSSNIDSQIAETKSKLVEVQSQLASLESTSSKHLLQQLMNLSQEYTQKQRIIFDLQKEVANAEASLKESDDSVTAKQALCQDYDRKAEQILQSFPSLENQRRKLHGELQELKGNIRVFCRIKPSEKTACASFRMPAAEEYDANGKQVLVVGSSTPPPLSHFSKDSRSSTYKFEFDKVFGPACLNNDIFPEIAQLIQTSLDGSNVCVFAYGQTGSGKTWTMSHREDGMIPSSFKQIFSHIALLKEQGWLYQVEGQFIEIYNDQIVDLLATNKTAVKHEIKHDDLNKQTEIQNCKTIRLESEQHAAELLDRATSKRSTAFTMANSRSSRSHSIFILKIVGHNGKTGQTTRGTLNLIDLAGSERLNMSQVKGDRLKETQAINKSLSCLADVIFSLSQRQSGSKSHIPYRNSKLTYLLKHSLGGDSKTLMFVNISPMEENLNETINSLRFAAKVNNTKTNV